MTTKRIYVSGPLEENLLPAHRGIRNAILERIPKWGFTLRGFYGRGTSDGYNWDPEGISGLIDRCHGMLVLAFPRWRQVMIEGGVLEEFATTEYVHVEGTLAVARSKPVLVIRHEDVRERGVLGHEMTGRAVTVPRTAEVGWLDEWSFSQGVDAWAKKVHKSKDVFLGYCSEAYTPAKKIKQFLENEGVSVLDWQSDFSMGENIFEQIKQAAERCSCGIFLFTKDDEFGASGAKAAPRDNVVFEAGYFSSAKGKSRTVIILQTGAKFPADLGGDVYVALKNPANIGPIEAPIRNKLTELGVL
jgi:predicted nucleotide-binding protein with TIR-like domain